MPINIIKINLTEHNKIKTKLNNIKYKQTKTIVVKVSIGSL